VGQPSGFATAGSDVTTSIEIGRDRQRGVQYESFKRQKGCQTGVGSAKHQIKRGNRIELQ
jgi:hypothetical protein